MCLGGHGNEVGKTTGDTDCVKAWHMAGEFPDCRVCFEGGGTEEAKRRCIRPQIHNICCVRVASSGVYVHVCGHRNNKEKSKTSEPNRCNKRPKKAENNNIKLSKTNRKTSQRNQTNKQAV